MKRTAVWLAAVFVAGALIITVARLHSAGDSEDNSQINTEERSRISRFWTIYDRASALRTRGEFLRAADLYRQALQLNPSHEDSLYYLGSCLYEMGEYTEAEQQLRGLIALNPESGRAYGQLGRVLSVTAPGAAQDAVAARQAFERELQIYTEQAGPLLELGGLELNQGELAQAEREFRTAARLGSAEAEFLLGYTLFLQNRRQEAEHSFEKVVAKYRADAKLTSKGVLSEGDILPAPDKPLTALQRAALKSMLLSYWNRRQSGQLAPAAGMLRERAPAPEMPALRIERLESVVRGGGAGAWADFAHDGQAGLAAAGESFALYRWQAGHYVDVTGSAGLGNVHGARQAYWVYLRGDNFPDLYLLRAGTNGGGSVLYRNQGDGSFRDVSAALGLAGQRSTQRACFGKFTGEGRTDLLEVGAAGEGSSVRLFRNSGTRFVEVTAASGLASNGIAVDCAVADYDGDGKPDIFVQFWRRPARLFHNQGGGRFVDVTARAGLTGIGAQGYSSIFFDYDRDGRPDLLVTAQAPLEQVARWVLQPAAVSNCAGPRLFHNEGGAFREVTREAGLGGCYGTIQALSFDFDQDGWPDLLLVSGSLDAQHLAPSVLFRNLHGKKFVPWAGLPETGNPANFLSAAVRPGVSGAAEVYLGSGPLPGALGRGGLFRIIVHGVPHSSSPASAPQKERGEAIR